MDVGYNRSASAILGLTDRYFALYTTPEHSEYLRAHPEVSPSVV